MIDRLAFLSTHEPDAARAARVRARCHAVLRRQRIRDRRAPTPAPSRLRRSLEPAIVGCLCAVYLFEVLSRALRLYRF